MGRRCRDKSQCELVDIYREGTLRSVNPVYFFMKARKSGIQIWSYLSCGDPRRQAHVRKLLLVCSTLILLLFSACSTGSPPSNVANLKETIVEPSTGTQELQTDDREPVMQEGNLDGRFDAWTLWVDGPHLRGANIYQRRVYLELDGPEFMGDGSVGPPYRQQDFDTLALLGANYVNISHPGLFSENPPYILDSVIQENLDRLLAMIAEADMFAVIAFRTGPGRSEFTFHLEEVGDWFDDGYLNDQVWEDPSAQQAWIEMWRYTAQRYQDNPIVVGYELMVEPNANEVYFDEWDPEVYHQDFGGTIYDWNQLFPKITSAVREVDSETPILVGGMGYSAVEWLPYLEPSSDPRTVYIVHQYAPYEYTHQESYDGSFYPGILDTDYDGRDDEFYTKWLEALLSPIGVYKEEHGAPVAVTEYGLVRWAPGGQEFIQDSIRIFEDLGLNHAVWQWEVSWESYAEEVHVFNYRLGDDPSNREFIASTALLSVLHDSWRLNQVRPSSIGP